MAEQTNIQKPQAPAAKKADKNVSSNVGGIKNASIVILVCAVIAFLFFIFVLGNGSNFKEGDNANAPLNLLGTIYKGGYIVPILQTLFLTVIVLSVERWIALGKAKGSGNITKFVADVKKALRDKDIDKAEDLCKKQKGTVGAVVFATLQKYKEMENDKVLQKEQKLTSIQQTLE